MDFVQVLTGIEGRISRQPFWIALIPIIAVEIAAHLLMGERWSSIVSLLLAYPTFAVLAKRGHDRDVPTWVPGLFVAGGIVLDLLVLFDLAGPMDRPNAAVFIIGIPLLIALLILIVDFGFRRGTAGPNRFGPDPLAAQS